MLTTLIRNVLIVALLFNCYSPLTAQEMTQEELYKLIAKQDSLLFTEGFNKCDIQQFDTLLSDDFEFFHDQSGITNTKAAFITSIKDGICKLSYKPQRELDKQSLEVFPLRENGALYGAIQEGTHRFYAIEEGKPQRLTSTARFTHLWLLEDESWKLVRSYSYDHRESDSIDESLLFRDRGTTNRWLHKKNIPAVAIGYIENGAIKEILAYGQKPDGQPYLPNTIFNVASLTKPITAITTLKLVNAGSWDLDAPISKYWTDPDVADDPRSKALTTRHILSHQTGFPNWRYKNADGKLAFEFDPGTKYQYSGEGFEYLRKALEQKFKKPLDQLASELIFSPLQMSDTRFYWDETVEDARFAKWYKKDGSEYPTTKNKSPNAADDLLTTAEDYSKFLLYVMTGAGLNRELFREMISTQTETKQKQHFGLGWLVDEDVNGKEDAITHGGDDKGVHTIVFLLPKSKKGLLIFTNCDHGTDVYVPVIKNYLGTVGQQIIDIETK